MLKLCFLLGIEWGFRMEGEEFDWLLDASWF